MAIVVEDGTIVSNANSYVTSDEVIVYASARGTDLDDTSIDVDVLLIKAMDNLEGREAQFKGNRIDADQPLSWPRENVNINGFDLESAEESYGTQYTIPQQLKNAQMQLVLYLNAGVNLAPITGGEIKRKKIGPLETEYFAGQTMPNLDTLERILAPICKSSFGTMRVIRG